MNEIEIQTDVEDDKPYIETKDSSTSTADKPKKKLMISTEEAPPLEQD